MVVSVYDKTSKFDNLKSTHATTERCSEKKDVLQFLKNKSKLLNIYKKLLKITCGVNFW